MDTNFPTKHINETIAQIPDALNEEQLSKDAKSIVESIKPISQKKQAEEEKNHLTAWAAQIANIDEVEAEICCKIIADKYPDLMFKTLMEQMYDLMKSRDEVNKSLMSYFGKRNEVFKK